MIVSTNEKSVRITSAKRYKIFVSSDKVWEVCMVTMGHLRLTMGHLRVTIGHLRLIMGHLRLTIGYLKANTTELHPKVRQTCSSSLLLHIISNDNAITI